MVDVSVNFTLEEQETYNAEFVVTPDVTYVADMKVLTGTRDHTELYNRDVANQHPMSAITGLEGALSNEATARENADTQLQNNIDAEVLRATTAEDSLNTKIEAETSRAESMESQLSDDIVAENTRALSAEETLQDNINTEETRAKGVENQLRNDLTAETTRASTAEEGLRSAINTEKSRAEDAENALRVDLEELETSINDDISDLNNKIEAETSRAETAETTLTTNLNSEISTRVSEISRVEGLIVAEEERATNVESDLQSDISSEASTRASEITRVEGLISAETSRATGIENTLREDLTSEITARQNADTTLQNSITAEATTRSNADTTLQNNIDTLTTTVSSNYTTLDNKITTETTNRENADNNLQSQIDAITASSDVTDIVGTYAQLLTYDTSTLAPNSIIKVLQDENRNNETTYYRWVITGGVGSWVLIGEEGPYYTKSEADSAFVPQSRTINGQALSANITLTASDVGATTQSYVDTELSTKQDVISDLSTIRSGAALGTTAVQPSDLATVATSGNYNDLSNKPTIPAAQVNADWNATSGVARILNKPTIPTVPTNVSAFTNDAGYITSSALNGYATQTWVGQQGYLTGITSNDVTSALGYTPYDSENPDGYITSSALAPYATTSYVDTELEAKQDVLTAGTDLEIVGYAPTTVSGNGSVSLNNAIANGLISVTLTGGCEQNGTPTPTNPVDIICNNGAIKYSKNIFDKTLNATAAGSVTTYWEIQVPNGTYTCSTDIPNSGSTANVWFDIQTGFSSNVNPVYASRPRTITVTEGVLYVAVRSGGPYDSLMSGERWVQVEQGNTATTYHPYGIYIDGNIETISDGNGNTAIAEYLLSVGDYKDTQELLSGEITRNVGIKVLDGTESWYYSDSGGNSTFYSSSTISTNVFGVSPYSNRYRGIPSASGRTDGNIYIININNNSRLDIVDNRFTNATDWKAYLSEQYYAGNPVIVVYAIGDSTSETAQAQTLTTQEGSNTISITQASINNLPVSVNYNMSGNAVINFTNETGYTSFSEIKDKLAYYGTCTTGAATQNKIVDCNGFELSEGVSIRIKFTNAQTYNGQPTLNVNNTGAIGIALRSDTDGIRYMWQAGDVIEFTYDGTNWIWERGGVATTTYWGVTKLTSSATTSSASLSLTASSLNAFSRDMVSGAQTYSTSTTYVVGDRVRYQYQTWECTSPTTGTWNENSWNALDPLQIQVDGKQDNLVSGTNIKTINNTSILGSGNIDIQGGSSYTAGTGIDITNDVISVTNAISTGAALGATAVQPSDLATVATSGSYSDLTNIPTNLLKNIAIASSALTISGIATNQAGAINIGTSSQATGSYGVSIGSFSYANGSMALGLGYSARATAKYAIQLGQGTNSTASTLYVGFNNSNYLLLDGTTGLIPDARLSSNILRSADLSGYATENWVNNQGYLTGITSSDVTTALGYTPYNATNPNGYITSSALSGYALDADVVHLTGTQAITGEKTFNNTLISRKAGGPAIACDDPNKIKGTAPSPSINTVIRFRDTNGSNLGAVYHNYGTDKKSVTAIQVTKANTSSDTVYAQVAVHYPASGDPYATAPASDVDGSIVTTVNKSKAANGYFKLGNGLIIQWGRISITANNATGSVTFPKAFTSTNYSITAAGRRSAGSGQGEISITETYSTTGFSWRSNAAASYYNNQQFWIAIGY